MCVGLPPTVFGTMMKTDHSYSLRPRCHSFSLTVKTDSEILLTKCLLKTFISLYCFVWLRSVTVIVNRVLKRDDVDDDDNE